jgi:hypothetical protein
VSAAPHPNPARWMEPEYSCLTQHGYQNSQMYIGRLIYNLVMYFLFLLCSHSTAPQILSASIKGTPTPSVVKVVP